MTAIFDEIRNDLESHPVVLYMKGSDKFPMCGFSAAVVQILHTLNVDFKAKDVLQNGELREGIKSFTQWPTLPQLYVKGEFIGGCDIIREMYQTGELQALLKEKQIPFTAQKSEQIA